MNEYKQTKLMNEKMILVWMWFKIAHIYKQITMGRLVVILPFSLSIYKYIYIILSVANLYVYVCV